MTNTETRYAVDPGSAKAFDTAALRDHFHVGGLFAPDELKLAYTHYDRMILGSCVPTSVPMTLDHVLETGTASFLDRRELAILNIGQPGTVSVAEETYALQKGEVLYVGKGAGPVTMSGGRFYLLSTPAHQNYPTKLIRLSDANLVKLGDVNTANERVIMQIIHPNVCDSCQLVMGYTKLSPGSVWNTMPAHVHDRRMEAYLYFDLPCDQRIVHFMGQPNETRHIIVANEEAVLSPPWSIHSGVGTTSYSFCWAMAGDNVDYTDMDMVDMADLR